LRKKQTSESELQYDRKGKKKPALFQQAGARNGGSSLVRQSFHYRQAISIENQLTSGETVKIVRPLATTSLNRTSVLWCDKKIFFYAIVPGNDVILNGLGLKLCSFRIASSRLLFWVWDKQQKKTVAGL
jgi:hypothetical protein